MMMILSIIIIYISSISLDGEPASCLSCRNDQYIYFVCSIIVIVYICIILEASVIIIKNKIITGIILVRAFAHDMKLFCYLKAHENGYRNF